MPCFIHCRIDSALKLALRHQKSLLATRKFPVNDLRLPATGAVRELKAPTLCFELKVVHYSWLFALGSGAGVGMRGSISARVAAL